MKYKKTNINLNDIDNNEYFYFCRASRILQHQIELQINEIFRQVENGETVIICDTKCGDIELLREAMKICKNAE